MCGTWGRFSLLRDSLACFLLQDYANKELIIYNQHSVPIICNFPGVRVINDPDLSSDDSIDFLRIRQRQIDLARGEYLIWWDDDDLWFPWALSQAVENFCFPAWAPTYHWYTEGLYGDCRDLRVAYATNVAEPSTLVSKDVILTRGYSNGGNNISPWPEFILQEQVRTDLLAAYICRWGIPCWHISGQDMRVSMSERIIASRKYHQDSGEGKLLTPSDITQYYFAVAKHSEGKRLNLCDVLSKYYGDFYVCC